jgi:DNA-directed RNA polymerase specialized sigma24 family protein
VAYEALLRVWRYTADFDSRRASVATWVLTITRNLAIDALRAGAAGRPSAADPLRPDVWSAQPEPGHAAFTSTSIGKVKAALNDLPAEQRRAVRSRSPTRSQSLPARRGAGFAWGWRDSVSRSW